MKLLIVVFFGAMFLCAIILSTPKTINFESLADAIFEAEGGWESQYLYGIRSVSYDSPKEARRICLNTLKNQQKRHQAHDCDKSYIVCLRDRYCPIKGSGLTKTEKRVNIHWLRNVKFFYNRKETNEKK